MVVRDRNAGADALVVREICRRNRRSAAAAALADLGDRLSELRETCPSEEEFRMECLGIDIPAYVSGLAMGASSRRRAGD